MGFEVGVGRRGGFSVVNVAPPYMAVRCEGRLLVDGETPAPTTAF